MQSHQEPSQPKEDKDKDKVKNGKNYNDFFKPSTNLKEQDKGPFKVPDKLTPVVNPGIRYFGQ